MMDKEKHNPVVKNRAWRMVLRALAMFMGIAAVLASCRPHDSQADKRLLAAETVMHSHPDSALHLLQAIPHPEKFKGLDQGLYALLRTQAAFKNGIPVASDSLITIAVDYFSQTPDSLRKAWSCFYAGQVYRDLKDFPKAIRYYHRAASAGKNIEDYKFLELLYYHWGLLIYQDKPYEEGLEKLQKSKEYAEKDQNSSGVIYCLGEMAWSYLLMKDYQKSEQCLNEAIALAKKIEKLTMLGWLNYRLSLVFYANKNYTSGLKIINDGFTYLPSQRTNLRKNFFMLKGDIFYELQKYDSAQVYYLKGIDSTNLYSIAIYHLSMTKIKKKSGDYSKALEYHEQFSNYMDSIKHEEEDERVMELQKKYDMAKVKNENMKLKEANLYHGITVLFFFLFFLLFIIIITFIIYSKKKKEKELVIQTKNKLLMQSMLQLQHKSNALLQTENQIQKKECEIDAYRVQLQNLKLQLFKLTEVAKKIYNLNKLSTIQKNKKKKELLLSKQDKIDLFDAMNFCDNGFEERLRTQYPKLADDDILLCCLLKMKISNEDIIVLLELNDETLKKRKYRIKHDKMNISRDISLSDFIESY